MGEHPCLTKNERARDVDHDAAQRFAHPPLRGIGTVELELLVALDGTRVPLAEQRDKLFLAQAMQSRERIVR